MRWNGENCYEVIKWEKNLQQMTKLRENLYFETFLTPGGVCPCPGLYTFMWPLFSNIFFYETTWPIKAKF